MTELNKRIKDIPMPRRLKSMPISEEGYPIPYFVPYIDGKPDFRGMDGDKFKSCVMRKRCWLCGEPLGRFVTFVIGPMCGINHTSSEPPSHRSCAEYAARACPFLTQPKMRRNEKDMPENRTVAGIMIKRNPGVAMLWTTMASEFRIMRDKTGVLFNIGVPIEARFFYEGRRATREEILGSIHSGLPLLREYANNKDEQDEITERYNVLLTMLPRE
jgi:hypothetical protein